MLCLEVFCHLRIAQGLVARCAMVLRMCGKASANCAPRRQGWRVAPASAEESGELPSSAHRAGEDGASRQSVGLASR
ncbi:hypothetical protein A2U01_0057220, partial [Trifolium medium]|nr:hypothetical protein [Trifolium medium]